MPPITDTTINVTDRSFETSQKVFLAPRSESDGDTRSTDTFLPLHQPAPIKKSASESVKDDIAEIRLVLDPHAKSHVNVPSGAVPSDADQARSDARNLLIEARKTLHTLNWVSTTA